MFYVYILRSVADRGYYIGQSRDIFRRLKEHNSGKTRSLRHRRPLIPVHIEAYLTRVEAKEREKKLKSFKGGNAFGSLLEPDSRADT